jgi:glycogen debranching enzyme
MEIQVGPPTVTIHADDEFAVSELNAEMSSPLEQGYFVADTRLVSGYRLKLGGSQLHCSDSAALHHRSARFEFTNPAIVGADGDGVPEHCLHLRLDRSIGRGIHEDYCLTNHSRRRLVLDLEVSIESDFADLFDVRTHHLARRGRVQSSWRPASGQLITQYRNGEFARGLLVAVERAGSPPEYANGGIFFRITLEPAQRWHTCVLWRPILGAGRPEPAPRSCHDGARRQQSGRAGKTQVPNVTSYSTGDAGITRTLAQAADDLAAMRIRRYEKPAGPATGQRHRGWVPAAGIPWYVTLFGRDLLTVSLQTLSFSPALASGALSALGDLQGNGYDDERDMAPGKIPHEIRHGELAALKLIPHTPYYGTHEATSLYVIAAAAAWRWSGDRVLLEAYRPHVEAALAWIDTDGDLDGDGLQEYRTRSSRGYYNQGWKDAGDAIVGADGEAAKLPIALVEHQALAAAAKAAWARVLDDVGGDRTRAATLHDGANRLIEALETRFWWDEEGTYYLGLDGDKVPIASVSSNPGQVLWTGVVDAGRAARAAARLLAPDLWSGWGIRTLSANHPAYNPFSYQTGSVWPHDNALAAGGLRSYGLDEQATQVARGLFDAAGCFVAHRLPELFAGLDRDPGAFPVPCLGANVPQAWASGAALHLIAILLGLEADAPAGVLRLRPALPDWLAQVTLERLRVGTASIDLTVRRRADGSHDVDLARRRGRLEVYLAEGPPGPLL